MPTDQTSPPASSPPRQPAGLPRFQQPPTPEPTAMDRLTSLPASPKPEPGPHSRQTTVSEGVNGAGRSLLGRLKPGTGETRTPSSAEDTTGRTRDRVKQLSGLDAKEAAAAAVGIVALVVTAAVWASTRGRRKFREPTEPETDAIAKPLGRIVARHAAGVIFAPDAIDGLAALRGVAAYVKTGPLTEPTAPRQSGVPQFAEGEDQ